MSVNTSQPSFLRPPAAPYSGQRLYLREEELDTGIEMLFDAVSTVKNAALTTCVHNNLNWTQGRALVAMLRRVHGVQSLSVTLGLTKQAAIKTIEELVALGLVVREANPQDKRRRSLVLTQAGRQIGQEIATAMRTPLAAAYRKAGGEAVAGCDLVLATLTKERR